MLHPALEQVIDDLLSAWRSHDDIRRSRRTTYAELANSHVALQRARSRAHRLRIALHPYGNDVELIATAVLCDRLDEIVHVSYEQLELGDGWRAFECICGQRVVQTFSPDRRPTA